MDEPNDQVLLAVLAQLWQAALKDRERPWSLARLSKQSGVPMSSLRRWLSYLRASALVEVAMRADGCAGTAWLTEEGLCACRELFAA